MNETSQVLHQIYTQYGSAVFKDKHRLISFIKDLLNNKDTYMLTLAVNQGVAISIIDTVNSENDSRAIGIIISELVSRYMWQDDLATMVVNYFVYAKFGKYVETNITIESAAPSNPPPPTDNNQFLIANKVLVKYKGALENIAIPSGVTSIGDRAFYNCSSVRTLTMPSSVSSIGNEAFFNCRNLTSLQLPSKFKTIGVRAFFNCTSLTHFTIPKGVKAIQTETFSDCRSLKTVDIPSTVDAIGDSAFDCCSNIESITIPRSVRNIGNYAFKGCSILRSIETPESVRNIGNEAFGNCFELCNAQLLEGVSSIGFSIFNGCQKLEYIVVPSTLKTIKTKITSNRYADQTVSIAKMEVLVPGDKIWSLLTKSY